MIKLCPRCKKYKKKEEFVPNRARRSGISPYCRECNLEYQRIKYQSKIFKKICPVCQKEFEGFKNKVYCSSRCKYHRLYLKPDGYKECLCCKKPFPIKKTTGKHKTKLGIAPYFHKFCSKLCAVRFTTQQPEYRKKLSEILKGRPSPFKGVKLPPERVEKIRLNNLGPKSHFWKGGITPLRKQIREHFFYKEWRKKIFERDNYTCQLCGQRGKKLEADHIKPFSVILEEYQIKSLEDALKCEEFWDITNGRTLCKECHKKETIKLYEIYKNLARKQNNVLANKK